MTELPLAALDPDRVAAALGLSLTEELRERLLATPRLAPRVARLVAARRLLGSWETAPFKPAERRLMQLDHQAFRRLGLAAGAVWHADALRATIMAKPRTILLDGLGEEIYALAIAHPDLAVDLDENHSAETLLEAIAEDGLACLAAWCDTLDPAAGAWFHMKLPADMTAPRPLHRAHGPALVDCVAVLLCPAEAAA